MDKGHTVIRLKIKIFRLISIYYIQTLITISVLIWSYYNLYIIHDFKNKDFIIVIILCIVSFISILISIPLWYKIISYVQTERNDEALKVLKVLKAISFPTSSIFLGYLMNQNLYNVNGNNESQISDKFNDLEFLLSKNKNNNPEIKIDKIKLRRVYKPLILATILHVLVFCIWIIVLYIFLKFFFQSDISDASTSILVYYLVIYISADSQYLNGIIIELWYDIKRKNYQMLYHNFITHFHDMSSSRDFRISQPFLRMAKKRLLEAVNHI